MAQLAKNLAAARATNLARSLVEDGYLYAMRDLSAANYYTASGGEFGTTSGSGNLTLFRVNSLGAALRYIRARQGASPVGWNHSLSASNVLGASYANASNVFVAGPTFTLQPSDIGKIIAIVSTISGTTQKCWVNRVYLGSVTQASYTPGTGVAIVGGGYTAVGANPATGVEFLGSFDFLGTPSDADVEALFDACRAQWDVPNAMSGATVSHLLSVRREALEKGLTQGSTAPAALVDRTTYASADQYARTGSPTIIQISPDLDGRRSFGVNNFSASAFYQATTAGIRGVSGAVTLQVLIRIDASPGSAAGHHLINNYDTTGSSGGGGFSLFGISGGIYVYTVNPGVSRLIYTITAADIGRYITVGFSFGGGTYRLYVDGAVVASGSGTLLCNTSTPIRVGRNTMTSSPEPSAFATVFKVAGCDEALSASEVATMYANLQATGRLSVPSGKTGSHEYDFGYDFAGQTTPTATITDRAGSDPLVRNGTGMQISARVERLFDYESSPIFYGAQGFTVSDNLSVTGGPSGSLAAGVHIGVLCRVLAQSTSAARAIVERINASFLGGYALGTTGLNSAFTFAAYNASGSAVSATTSLITAADVGKLLFVQGIIDVSGGSAVVRLINKRAATSANGTALASYTPPSSVPLYVGVRAGGTIPASDIQIIGLVGGDVGLSLAEAYSLADEVLAYESIRGVSGKSSWMIDFSADARSNGGALPASCPDRYGTAHLTRNGNPTVGAHYARAWSW